MFHAIPPGARYMLLSALGFAFMGMCVKLAGYQGIPVLEIIVARALVSLVLSVAVVKRKGIPLFGEHKFLLFMRGLVGFVALTAVYYSFVHLPYAVASVLQYLHPMFTAILALLFLKERISPATIICIILSFVGLLVMVRPDFAFDQISAGFDPIAVGIGIAGAFGSGVAYTLVRKLSGIEDSSVIVLYFPMVCLPCALFLLGDDFVMPTGWTWLTLLMVGIFTQIGQIMMTKGMAVESAGRATSFSYAQVVFAAILGVVVFDEIPGVWTIVGALLIMVGAIINILWKSKAVPAAPLSRNS